MQRGSKIDYILSCQACFSREGDPKQLPCRHSFCVDCIKDTMDVRSNTVKCTLCREVVDVPKAGPQELPVDEAQRNLRGHFIAGKGTYVCEVCNGSSGNPAELHCVKCRRDFCQECSGKHSILRKFQDHQLVPMPIISCVTHGKKLEHFCDPCKKLLCFNCVQNAICDEHGVSAICDIEEVNMEEINNVIEKLKNDIDDNRNELQPLRVKVASLKNTTDEIEDAIMRHAVKMKETIDRNTEVLLDQVVERRGKLDVIKDHLELEDRLEEQIKLLEATIAVKNGGIQQVLVSLQTIKEKIPRPPIFGNIDDLYKSLQFVPKQHLSIGALVETPYHCKDVWSKPHFGICDHVVFTGNGHIAVSDVCANRVLLLNRNKVLVADTSTTKKGNKLKEPRGIAYHQQYESLVVADHKAGHVTFLNADDLSHQKNIILEEISAPRSLSILSTGDLVVTQMSDDDHDLEKKIGVFSCDGSCINMWSTFGEEQKPLSRAYYVFVDREDRIWVTESGGVILAFNVDGYLLHEIKTPQYPYGISQYGDDILIAISTGTSTEVRYVGAVVAYNISQQTFKTQVAWQDKNKSTMGRIFSVSIQGSYLAVGGSKGLQLFKVNPGEEKTETEDIKEDVASLHSVNKIKLADIDPETCSQFSGSNKDLSVCASSRTGLSLLSGSKKELSVSSSSKKELSVDNNCKRLSERNSSSEARSQSGGSKKELSECNGSRKDLSVGTFSSKQLSEVRDPRKESNELDNYRNKSTSMSAEESQTKSDQPEDKEKKETEESNSKRKGINLSNEDILADLKRYGDINNVGAMDEDLVV